MLPMFLGDLLIVTHAEGTYQIYVFSTRNLLWFLQKFFYVDKAATNIFRNVDKAEQVFESTLPNIVYLIKFILRN